MPYRYLCACYAHMGRLAEAREILARLRAISSIVIPDAGYMRNSEHRELFLSGLRLASGDDSGITAPPLRVDLPHDPLLSQHHEAERRQITALHCELAGGAPGADGVFLKTCARRSTAFSAAYQRRPIATKGWFPGSWQLRDARR